MPSPSPTTTSAVKLKRRPPFTTLATRLMATTRSMYAALLARRAATVVTASSVRAAGTAAAALGSAHVELPSSSSCSVECRRWSWRSERQPALAGAVGQGRDAAVVLVAGSVEDDSLDTGPLGALGDQLADLAWPWRSCRPRTCAGRPPWCWPRRASCRPRSSTTWTNDVLRLERVTTRRGRSAVPAIFLRPRTWRRSAGRDLASRCDLPCAQSDTPCHLPAFPTLRRTCSPAYRTPLPL